MSDLILPLRQGRCAAKVWGNETDRPILALHGWLDNAGTFDALAPLLPGFRMLALDLPGHGDSDPRPPGMPYHFVDYVTEVCSALEYLKWRPCLLVGHSMGAGIAALVAGILPELVERLVMIESYGALTGPPEEFPDRLALYLREEAALSKKEMPLYSSPAEAAAARRKVSTISESGALAIVSRGLKPVPGGFTWKSDPRLRLPSGHRLTEPALLSTLARISCPTLVIRANEGLPFPQADVERRLAHLKHLQLERVPGNHHVHLDAPELVAPLVREFLK